MRRVVLFAVGLSLARLAPAEDAPERPILVLDAGGHTAAVGKVLFTPDGKELISVSSDKTIRVWDVATGEPLRVLRPPIGAGPEGRIYTAALAPDGRTLAVGGYDVGADSAIYLIEPRYGRVEGVLRGHADVIYALAFSADGARLASGSGDKTARIWDVAGKRCERVLGGHDADVMGVAFAPDGLRVATASIDRTGRIWSLPAGRAEAVLRGHAGEVRCVAWRPDGRAVLTGSLDRSLRRWAPDGGPLEGPVDLGGQVISLAFSADARTLLATCDGGGATVALLLDPSSGRERMRFDRHSNSLEDGVFSPDGRLAATSDQSGVIYLWKTEDGAVVHRLAGRGRPIFAVGWGRDGEAVAWGNLHEGDIPNGRGPLEREFRPAVLGRPEAAGTDLRGAQATLGPLSLEGPAQTSLAVKRAGAAIATLKMDDPYNHVLAYTLLPGGRAAVGGSHGLYLFDARSGAERSEFLAHTGHVYAVAPSPDGRHLLSGSDDQTLRIWDPARPEPLLSLFVAGDEWVAWTPEGYYAASAGGESLAGWQVNNGPDRLGTFYPAGRFRKAMYRPDALKLLLKSGGLDRALLLANRSRGKKAERTAVAKVLPPRVEVSAPLAGSRPVAPKLEVKATAKPRAGHPITAMRLLVDGRPYRGQAGEKSYDPPRRAEVRASWAIELDPGTHALAVQADSPVSLGVSAPVEVVVAGADRARAAEKPALYVLSIGISAYPGSLKLASAARDAAAIEDVFRAKGGPQFRAVEVRRLEDAQASRKGVLDGLGWLRERATREDVAVVSFIGRGRRDPRRGLYLLPADADLADLGATAIAEDVFKGSLAGTAGRVIALLDACHDGDVGAPGPESPSNLTDDLVRDLVTDAYGVAVLASGTGREVGLEDADRGQGYFARALVEGLSGAADANKDGVVYLHELEDYVPDRVKGLSGGRQHPIAARPAGIRSFPLSGP